MIHGKNKRFIPGDPVFVHNHYFPVKNAGTKNFIPEKKIISNGKVIDIFFLLHQSN